jgi:1-deoxy-D-xylulose-5-phosphate reductoisomerase
VIVLGCTGSIGVNTLEIAKKFGLNVDVLVAGNNIALLNRQIETHRPSVVVVGENSDPMKVNHHNVLQGEAAILEMIEASNSELVVNALVGFIGLRPTLKAIETGKRVALANKESLVAGGAFIDTTMIQPIDSEHFGLWYLNNTERPIERMLITASGGAFRDWPIEKIRNATLEDALNHPNWAMGQKITIDSASMMNKMFELLEARWLFGEGNYDAIIETRSLIHALIDYKDGSTTAHFAKANMQLPIAYAVNGSVDEAVLKPVNLLEVGSLEFREITPERYPVWEIKDELLKHPERGVVVNAANEAAIEHFVLGNIGFMDISKTIIDAFERFDSTPKSIDDVFALDAEVRTYYRRNL